MKLLPQEIQDRLTTLTGWEFDGQMLVREWTFRNFREAMHFVKQVADLAEAMDHHPDIYISYNRVRLSLMTHSEGGITDRDFQLAAQINRSGS
ncbi:MAG: 4a-hydroxytetrahydrobiopterin dehydratase [Calditrichaeota bacterium]|nr:4a-hydroxytetrahydrobiopterin dehydratase [Calditrichota bacterium]